MKLFAFSHRWPVGGLKGLGTILLIVASAAFVGCDKKAPPDPHIQAGYQLLRVDPQRAYDEFEKAKDTASPTVLLGKGLALELLQKYQEAEPVLVKATAGSQDLVAWLALARVRVVLGKRSEAQLAIDKVAAVAPYELTALFLEACLANDEARAKTARSHFEQWLKDFQKENPAGTLAPAEYYLAQLPLLKQLEMRTAFERAAKAGKQAKLAQTSGALALVEIAARTERRSLALELLRKIHSETSSEEGRRQVARIALGLGDLQLAGQIVPELLGNDAEVLNLQAEYEYATGQVRAENTLRRALLAAKEQASRSRLQLLLAETLLRNEKLEESRKQAEGLLNSEQNQAATLLLARLDLAEDKPGAALERLKPELAKPQASLAVREIGARIYVDLGQQENARALIDAILQTQPSHTRAAQLRVALEFQAGKPKEAVQAAKALVKRVPQDVALRMLLAEALEKANGKAAAIRSLSQAVADLEKESLLWMELVRRLEANNANADALAALETAHKKLPEDALLTAALASRLAKVDQAERAAALYEELIKSAHGDAAALNNLAMLYTDRLDDPARGVALAEQAYALAQAPAVMDTLGWALLQRGAPKDLKRAHTLLLSASQSLTSPTSKYHLGAVLIAIGKQDQGKQIVRQALAQSEDFPEAARARQLVKTSP